ncbi:MAG: hypothetical protein NWF09_01000 [Candidatus Bathyarchaeota archaeon]|nr:hypothetical protein [Candidatus Bathyarchaeota archaeon]
MAKNIGTSNLMLRVDQEDAQGNVFKYIINAAEQKVWVYYNGEWTDLSDNSLCTGINGNLLLTVIKAALKAGQE